MLKEVLVRPRAPKRTGKTDGANRVSTEAVSRRAYTLFQARGREHGHDVEDWLVAEIELHNAHKTEVVEPLTGSH